MANPINIGNIVVADPNQGYGLTEYTRAGNIHQSISDDPGGDHFHITQNCQDLLVTPESSGDVIRFARWGANLGTLIPASEFGTGAQIHMAQCDQNGRLFVLYEELGGSFKLKRFDASGLMEVDFGPTTYQTVTVDATSSTTAASVSSVSWNHTCSGSFRMLVVASALNTGGGTIPTITSVTYNGVALSHATAANGFGSRSELWYLVAPPTGTHQIIVNYSVAGPSYAVSAISYNGVMQSSPIRGTAGFGGVTSNNLGITVPSAPGDLVMDVLNTTRDVTATVGPGQTVRLNVAQGAGGGANNDARVLISTEPSSASSVAMTWVLNIGAYAISGMSIKPAAIVEPPTETGIAFSDGFHNDYLQQTADINEDGTAIYVAAGEWIGGGTRNIPIYKIELHDNGAATVIPRWAVAASGAESAEALTIDGATVIHSSGITSVVVGQRLFPGATHADIGWGHDGIILGPGEEGYLAMISSTPISVTQKWWFNLGMLSHSDPVGDATARFTVEPLGISVVLAMGAYGGLGHHIGSTYVTQGTVPLVHVQNLSDTETITLNPDYGANQLTGATHPIGLFEPHTFEPISGISNTRYRLRQFDLNGTVLVDAILYEPLWPTSGHRAFVGIPHWAADDPFGGFYFPLGYDDTNTGTFLFRGSTILKDDVFNDGTMYDHIPIWLYWYAPGCVLTPVDPEDPPPGFGVVYPGIARVPRIGTTQDLFVRTTP